MATRIYKNVITRVLLASLFLNLNNGAVLDLPASFCQYALGQSELVRGWCVKFSEQFDPAFLPAPTSTVNIICSCCLGGRSTMPKHIDYFSMMDNEYLKAVLQSTSSVELLNMANHLSLCYSEGRTKITYEEFKTWSLKPNQLSCTPQALI